MTDWRPPAQFDGYELERLLGRGGMGEVHLARDSLLERPVAIKFISTPQVDAAARQRFLVEARAIARLQHPNVVAIYRIGLVQGYPYLVSEFVRGRSLQAWLRKLEPAALLRAAQDIAGALASAHRQGIIHRDLKPANAIRGQDGRTKLLDFGIAKFVQADGPATSRRSAAGSAAGAAAAADDGADATPPLPPPERAADDSDDATPALPPPGQAGHDGEDATPALPPGPQPAAAGAGGTSGVAEPAADPADWLGAGADAGELTDPGMLMGSPRYAAPELWQGRPASYRSDIYSFGALIYALCSGRPPHPEKDPARLRQQVLSNTVQPLAELRGDLDPAFCAIVDRCLARDPGQRYADGNALRSALARLGGPDHERALPAGNPYRGLRPFEAEHQALFFGRDSEIRMILDRLVADPFVLVVGDSGVGKSSLCRAGVLPRLGGWLDEQRRWSVARLVPGRHPVAALAGALAGRLDQDERDWARCIEQDPGGVGRRLRQALGGDRGLVLFIDQFEELLTQGEPAERAAVGRALAWLAAPTPGLRLLAAVRGDFLSRLANLEAFGDELTQAIYFLRPLSAERIREAVRGPARAKGVEFASAELVDELVRSTERAEGGLPLLQFALAELWQARGPGDTIDEQTLAAVGGVSGALARHADRVLAGLGPAQRDTARGLLLALVRRDGTRLRRPAEALCAERPGRRAVLDALVRGRLLVARQSEGAYAVEIAHEALVDGWPTLARWLADDAEARQVRERLQQAAADWQRLERDPQLLWSGPQLREAERLDAAALGSAERGFVQASRRRRRRRRLVRIGAAVGLPLLVLLIWAGLTLQARLERAARIDDRLAQARQQMEAAAGLAAAVEEQRRRALALFDRPEPQAAEARWATCRRDAARLAERYRRTSQLLEATLSLAPERADVRRCFADLLADRARLADRFHDRQRRDELLGRLRLYDRGGRRLAAWRAPARLELALAPVDSEIGLQRVRRRDDGRLIREPVPSDRLAGGGWTLEPGTYRLDARGPGRAPVRQSLLLEPGERRSLRWTLPAAERVPPDMVWVPPGRFLVGTAVSDRQRRDFFHNVPLHPVRTDGYLIARHETTFGQWIAFLESLPPAERRQRTPQLGSGGFKGGLGLERLADGDWRLTLKPADRVYRAREGQAIHYPGRERRARQDWLRLPVVGVSAADAEAYCAWLDRSGRVPGARLCSDLEWERAARGADGRPYPHGWRLRPDDANHDATYGRQPDAIGPDAVGAHPRSASPYGLHDMAGNVWELTRSAYGGTGLTARGGAYNFGATSCRAADREEVRPAFRDASMGFRVCADLQPQAPPPAAKGPKQQ